jgi:aminoglycoside phosphotransferase (APT) family kinase protein
VLYPIVDNQSSQARDLEKLKVAKVQEASRRRTRRCDPRPMSQVVERIREDLQTYCREQLGRPELYVGSIQPIPEGHSGFTYFVVMDDGTGPRTFVLRLPPPGARIAGPADVVRQGRIMAALHSAGLPTPGIPVLSSEAVVDGRPFVLMDRLEGVRVEKAGVEQRAIDLARSAVDVLKLVHALPVARTGIGDEEPVGLEMERKRWAWLMQRAPEALTERAGELGDLLAARMPAEREPTLVHGDYHYGNLLFSGSEVVAVLDWEIAQIGQPLLDLGCLCTMAHRRRYSDAPNPGGAVDVSLEDLCGLYDAGPEEMAWYFALSLYKYASILGYNLMLHRRGKRPDPMFERLPTTILGMIAEGIAVLKRSA